MAVLRIGGRIRACGPAPRQGARRDTDARRGVSEPVEPAGDPLEAAIEVMLAYPESAALSRRERYEAKRRRLNEERTRWLSFQRHATPWARSER